MQVEALRGAATGVGGNEIGERAVTQFERNVEEVVVFFLKYRTNKQHSKEVSPMQGECRLLPRIPQREKYKNARNIDVQHAVSLNLKS